MTLTQWNFEHLELGEGDRLMAVRARARDCSTVRRRKPLRATGCA
jgi:hypothetical protein